MKKYIALFLALLIAVSFSACETESVESRSGKSKESTGRRAESNNVRADEDNVSENELDDLAGKILSAGKKLSENTGKSEEELSVFESDTATLNMLVKEAVNTYKAGITTTTYNGKTAVEATVHDVCVMNVIDDSDNYYSRSIGGENYCMVFKDNNVQLSGGDNVIDGYKLTGSETIVSLADGTPTKSNNSQDMEKYDLSVMKSDTATMNMLIKEAIYTYRAGITTTTYNGKTAAEATVQDICVENNFDYSNDFFVRKIDGVTYSMVFTVNYDKAFNVNLSGGDDLYGGNALNGSDTIVSLSNTEPNQISRPRVTSKPEERSDHYTLNVMESDGATMSILIKEAINIYIAKMSTISYNGKTAAEATVHDICVENNIDDSNDYYSREIDGVKYSMVFGEDNNIFISGGDKLYSGVEITGFETIVSLAEYNN